MLQPVRLCKEWCPDMGIQKEYKSLFGQSVPLGDLDEFLIHQYEEKHRTLDDLPYTKEFEDIAAKVRAEGYKLSNEQIFHKLLGLRKAGDLPKLGKAWSPPLMATPDVLETLQNIVLSEIGHLSLRDRLLYTPEFDKIADRFRTETKFNLDNHEIWRLIARISK